MPFPISEELVPYLVYAVPVAAMLLAMAFAVADRRKLPFLQGILNAFLAGTLALAFLNYVQTQWRIGDYFNEYEFFHYYVGGKYAPEVGYTGMYEASLVASAELNPRQRVEKIRDLETGRMIPASDVLARSADIKARFSPARWQMLLDDTEFITSRISRTQWQKQLQDKGFNASPVWTMVGGGIANLVHSTNTRGMYALPFLDVAFLTAAAVAIAWAFGWRTMAFTFILLGTHMVMSHSHMKASYIRTDWVAALLIAVCCLRRGWFAVAGALVGYAAMVRLFPVVFGFGMGAQLVWTYWSERRLAWKPMRFLIAMAASMLVLFLLSAAYTGGLAYWQEFLSKIVHHNDDISPWRVGFKYVFLMSYNGSAFWQQDLAGFYAAHQTLWWVIQVLVLGIAFFAVRRLPPHEALAFGYVPMFFLVAPTYYYHIVLLVPALFFIPKLAAPSRLLGVLLLFASGMAAQRLFEMWGRTYALFFAISCMFLGIVVYLTVLGLLSRSSVAGADALSEDAETVA